MQIETLKALLSEQELKLISIIVTHIQKERSNQIDSQSLAAEAGMHERDMQQTLDKLGNQYSKRLTSSVIEVSPEIIELYQRLTSG